MFELKYFVARNDSPDIEPKRKIQPFVGAKPNIQPVRLPDVSHCTAEKEFIFQTFFMVIFSVVFSGQLTFI